MGEPSSHRVSFSVLFEAEFMANGTQDWSNLDRKASLHLL